VRELPKTTFTEIWRNLRCLLDILGDQPKRRTEWTLEARRYGVSTNQFNFLLDYMLRHGYVRRVSRGRYERTEKGKMQVEFIRCPSMRKLFKSDTVQK
jgi:hypothetical protein